MLPVIFRQITCERNERLNFDCCLAGISNAESYTASSISIFKHCQHLVFALNPLKRATNRWKLPKIAGRWTFQHLRLRLAVQRIELGRHKTRSSVKRFQNYRLLMSPSPPRRRTRAYRVTHLLAEKVMLTQFRLILRLS